MSEQSAIRIDYLREIAEAGMALGKTATKGQLEIATQTPTWALEPTDVTNHHHEHAHHDHEHVIHHSYHTAKAEDLVTSERAEKALGVDGFHPVVVKIKDLLSTPGLLSRVLLVPVGGVGFLPATVMPDPSKPGKGVKIITFKEPYDISNNNKIGIDEGKMLALSLDAMTKSEAGFGGHNKGRMNPFEGGHFTVGSIASKDQQIRGKIIKKGHSGTHEVIDGSVIENLRVNRLTSNDLPMPTIKTIPDITSYPDNAALTFYWRDNLTGLDGTPLRAIHPEASQIVVGNMIHELGSEGLDRVENFVLLASGAK